MKQILIYGIDVKTLLHVLTDVILRATYRELKMKIDHNMTCHKMQEDEMT